jgi:branched-chain amino acid transport system permease protein
VVLGGIGTVFGPLLGALAFMGLEEVLKGYTEHWMVVFGPLIVLVALFGRRGIAGWLELLDRGTAKRAAAAQAAVSERRA